MNSEIAETEQTTKLPAARILGSYAQKQTGLFMQRVKILGGRINWPQWQKVAELAAKYSSDTPVHITTRQDIELHNIREEDLPAVHQGLAVVGLSIFGTCGDTVRNITVSTGCQLCGDSIDVIPLAALIRRFLDQEAITFTLPRKFKISFSSCRHVNAKPWLNDLAFVALPNGSFTVIGAGSLGPRPATGIKLYDNLPARDVLPLCLAAVELFNDHGDRQNRHKARLRHVREKLGGVVFCHELNRYFSRIRDSRQWPDLMVNRKDQGMKLLYRMQLPNGNIYPQQAIALADAAEPKNAILRINIEHGLELYGGESVTLAPDIAAFAANPVIVACPGSTTCPRALADCWNTADNIRRVLTDVKHNGINISISGCPNNCAQSAAAAIGLVGVIRKINNQSVEHYQVLTGGGDGKNDKLAKPYGVFPAEQAAEVVKKIVLEGTAQ